MLGPVLFILFLLLLLGAIPAWPSSRKWGYFPTAGLGLILIVMLVLLLSSAV
ncbi:MAG: DUF3309 domain-containing protein [Chloroflexi bacterium]|nr:DUF3309 domain-containing protein [Chloroflexota bacterium]